MSRMYGTQDHVNVNVETGDALAFEADVLALKYAQKLYGVDAAAVERLQAGGVEIASRLPPSTGFLFVDAEGLLGAHSALFIGVNPLYQFGYEEIRDFGKRVLSILAKIAPQTSHLCLTLHGPGYGLDEGEAFNAEIAGLIDAITAKQFPERLRRATIIERSNQRAERLRQILSRLLPSGVIKIDRQELLSDIGEKVQERLETVGRDSNKKPHIFVAMPFDEKMSDIFDYGIQNAVNAAGFLCERADISTFTGDAMEWVRKRIKSASLIIADLTTANPNVYLEVGYAWGCGKPTILLVQDVNELKFDVKGHRCLVYKRIKQLEELLTKELANLRAELNW